MGHLPDITLLSFGKPKAIWQPILKVYEQRLNKAVGFRHVILREKGDNPDAVKANATKLIEPHTSWDTFVVVFDERGKSFSSPTFASMLSAARPNKVVAVVGTSYGLADDFLAGADKLVNLGAMTLPHELARATAIEQIYRAETILAGHPYHHG